MKQSDAPAVRRTGRPLSFDRELALDAAMHLFWRHGYEATSISELTRAMGVTPPSLYAAFGDKRRLFREAVERYLGGVDTVARTIAQAVTARAAAHDLLIAAAMGNTGEHTPAGCLLASSIVSASAQADSVRAELAAIRGAIETALRQRIERDIEQGRLAPATDAEALAGHIFAVVQGMSTLAKDGAGRDRLLRIVRSAMMCWPDPA